ncbi:efflux RND transporter permease subunit [Alcaligenes endophyticus]|uniref:Efflux RND transporter permease subunit n=1 Tax=Alcaligenes endophyticus TaxID=1929088 RepID=A0ABT8EG69_9BURK|nr:efflux RND transporter permease subunit [Alcaligenes endophyticus]MCX5590079.1 efflux RND transporter permease subunit [Alcaligenes endophyticus]MDN4120258.1 efflux RND transporter permease subunit [Alcaligenes endophyticus]
MRRLLSLFVFRPVGSSLLCLAMVLSGVLALRLLPVAPLPEMEFPVIAVTASLPGASPETMASSVATPLEQSLGSIAGISEMSSRSSEGSTQIILIFDLDRDIEAAARDVQAAINQARPMLPSGMSDVPTYEKANPSSVPIMVLALTSPTLTQAQLYDMASAIVQQKLSQISGVGSVDVGGGSLPAVRVSVNPKALSAAGIALDDIRTVINGANSLRPNGYLEDQEQQWQLNSGRQLSRAQQFEPLVLRAQNGDIVRLQDVARIEDSVENLHSLGFLNQEPAVLLIVRREAQGNIIDTVNTIHEQLESIEAMLPGDARLSVAQDRTPSIRAALLEAQNTLLIAVLLVVLVVLLFLRDWRAALIPAIAVPASLMSTFAFMYFFGFTLNTISLMALIVATGFVVDDAIVVLESIMRYRERGLSPKRSALRGVRDVGFTVTAMSLSLVAVFIPLWLVGGLVGRLFMEFAVTLCTAVLVSLVISLVLTPMMSALLLRDPKDQQRRVSYVERGIMLVGGWSATAYRVTLEWALRHHRITLLSLVATIGLNFYLYAVVPKGLFPQQDTGQLMGFFRVDRGMSFEAMTPKLEHFRSIITQDPDVKSLAVFAGGRGGSTSSFMLVELTPLGQREASVTDVVNRLRDKFNDTPGARLFLVPQGDIPTGGGGGGREGSYDYMLLGSDIELLRHWAPKVRLAMSELPELVDVDDSREDRSGRVELEIDRDRATRLGVDMALVASTLNNSFSQRQVSLIYGRLNQYNVVMGVEPEFSQDVQALMELEVITRDGNRVPLAAFTSFKTGVSPLSVNHQGLMVADSVSFGLADGVTLAQAEAAIEQAVARIQLPTREIQAGFEGNTRTMSDAVAKQPLMFLGALVALYIVLGMLYESYMHPLTILSTLPSAGVGALLALMLTGGDFNFIAMLGIFLLIGIVKKNAIMMVDYALQLQRRDGLDSQAAIYQACLVRFRPIMMTTLSAICGALPLIFASGAGVEMRQPLGVTIVGGLVLSQLLTLYTTPVVYLYLDRLRLRFGRKFFATSLSQ